MSILCAASLKGFFWLLSVYHTKRMTVKIREKLPQMARDCYSRRTWLLFSWLSSYVFLLIFFPSVGCFILACLPALNSHGQIELRKMGLSFSPSFFFDFRIFLQMKFLAKSISIDLYYTFFLPVFSMFWPGSNSQSFDIWFLLGTLELVRGEEIRLWKKTSFFKFSAR